MQQRAPYKYLDYYTFEDADIFFGREEETQKMVGEILTTRLLVLFSPSGSGKTSLINAGVRPALEKLGYQTVYVRLDKDPIPSVQSAVAEAVALSSDEKNSHSERSEESVTIAQAAASKEISLPINRERNDSDDRIQNDDLHGFFKNVTRKTEKPLVVFIDQFEEFFIVFENQPKLRHQFIEQVAKIKYDDTLPVFLVLSLREDYFANLHEFREAIPSIFQNNANLRLESFTEAEARRAIEEPVKVVGCEFEAGLVERMLQDLKNGKPAIEPITLQIVCNTVWEEKSAQAQRLTFADYKAAGGADHILNNYVSCFLDNLSARQQSLMAKIFAALKTPDDTKRYRTFEDLQATLKLRPSRLKRGLDQLVAFNLLRQEPRTGTNWYEFKHDYLVDEVTDWMQQRKERINRNKLIIYGTSPLIAIFLGLLGYFFYQYNSFYAGFVNPEYAALQEEIAIFRVNQPLSYSSSFREIITTGILREDVRDYQAENDLKEKFKLGFLKKNDWKRLSNKLKLVARGKFLYQLGEEKAGLDTLLDALKDQDKDIQVQAARTLIKFGQIDERVIGGLLALLKDQNADVRVRAVGALGEINSTDVRVIDGLLAALKDQNRNVRARAAGALGEIKATDAQVISALMVALKDQDRNVRAQAARAFGEIKSTDEWVIDGLLAALKDQVWYVRTQAAGALAKLGPSDSRVIDGLLVALKDQESYVRVQAAHAFGEIKSTDERVIAGLLAALKDQVWYVRTQAAGALVKLGQSDAQVIDALLTMLKDQNVTVREQAVGALGEIKSTDKRVTGALLTALKDQSENVQKKAVGALVKLDQSDKQAIGELLATLKDQNRDVRARAAYALGEITTRDERVIGELLAALKDQYEGVRAQAAGALARLDQRDEQVLDALLTTLKDQNRNIRVQAARAFGELKSTDERVISELSAALKDQDEEVRMQVAASLRKLELKKPLPQLLAQLAHPLSGYRTAAAQALAQKDIPIDSTLQVIVKLKEDERPWVRLGAWEAYELLEKRRKAEKKSVELLHEADSLLAKDQERGAKGEWQRASAKYESAFAENPKVTHTDSLNAARAKFQQARCAAKLKRVVPALDDLKSALEYNPTLRDTLQAEMAKPENDWKILAGNWYLREVLLKR